MFVNDSRELFKGMLPTNQVVRKFPWFLLRNVDTGWLSALYSLTVTIIMNFVFVSDASLNWRAMNLTASRNPHEMDTKTKGF
mmetsp:Transcript_15552/g.31464  ORF Transcript_15552/g.31464 Transcript_15552/m.31464 type:complete len:82 (-) Transcript_15552:775-1020(-)